MSSGACFFIFIYDSANGCLHSGSACATHGIHYIDLAGEPHFIKTIIQKSVNRSRFAVPQTYPRKTDTTILPTKTMQS